MGYQLMVQVIEGGFWTLNKIYYTSLLIFAFLLAGCSNSFKYSDEEVAAIVRGEEITIGELRFLYTDDIVLEMVEQRIKDVLVIQEAKKMNIDVSENVKTIVETFGDYPLSKNFDAEYANSIRKFVEPQAKKLGLDPKKYYKKYIEITAETNEYKQAYITKVLGELKDKEHYDEHFKLVEQLPDDLVEKYQDEIQILIK